MSPAPAQLAPIGVPRGLVRLEVRGDFEDYDRRFRDGVEEDYAADFSSPALGSDRFPGLAVSESQVAQLIGQPGYRFNLGQLTASSQATTGTLAFGVGYGVTQRFTLFATIPIVRTDVEAHLRLDSTPANAGFNPNDPNFGDGQAQAQTFFFEFDAALSTLSTKINNGDYDSNPSQRALADATLASGTGLRGGLGALIEDPATASPFLPTQVSAEGAALLDQVASLQSTLSGLGVTGFATPLPLPAEPFDQEDFESYLTLPFGPIAGRPLRPSQIFLLGDIEVGAAYTWLDRWDRGVRPGGIRSALEAKVRLATGYLDFTDNFFDLGSGDRQTDIDVRLVTDVGSGRWGARLAGRYVRQFPSTLLRRVTLPSQPFAPRNRLAQVRRDLGDIAAFDVQPFFRLTPTIALALSGSHWTRKSDRVTYASPGDSIPGVNAGDLALETNASATIIGGGVTYANAGALRPGGRGVPVDARLSYEMTVRASGGRVPKARVMRAELRLYHRLFR